MLTLALVNHKEKECGVHNFGVNCFRILRKSNTINYVYMEICSADELLMAARVWSRNVDAYIYNWHPHKARWLNDEVIQAVNRPQFLITGHDVTDTFPHILHNFVCDPTYEAHDNFSGFSRPIVTFDDVNYAPPDARQYIIGSFGFAQVDKQFPKIVQRVSNAFSTPVTVNLHMPFGEFVDKSGGLAASIAEACRKVAGPHVELNISHDFLGDYRALCLKLNMNDVNIFDNIDQPWRGCSSSIDAAISAQKPFGCNRSTMYRHVRDCAGVILDETPLQEIIGNGIAPTLHLMNLWSHERFIDDFESKMASYLAVYEREASPRRWISAAAFRPTISSLRCRSKRSARRFARRLRAFRRGCG